MKYEIVISTYQRRNISNGFIGDKLDIMYGGITATC
jgi:hypothetical protein